MASSTVGVMATSLQERREYHSGNAPMAFDDLHLERPPAPRLAPARSSTSRWVILGAGTVIAGALLALWWLGHAQPPPASLAPTTATDIARPPTRPQREPLELPALVDSDAMLRDLFS